jgi:mono/diheme cytochrome c family protein
MNWQPSWRQMQGREWGATLVVVLALLLSGCAERKEQAPTSIPAEPILEGKALYEVNCQACHGGETGGQMMDIPPPHNANGHTWHHPDCQLKEIVLQGSGAVRRRACLHSRGS